VQSFFCTRGSQNVMRPIFYFLLITRLTCEDFAHLYYNIVEGIVIFRFNLRLCGQSSSTFEQERVHAPSKSCSPSSAAMAHSVLEYLFISLILPPQASPTSQNCRVDAAASKICDSLCGAHACVLPNVIRYFYSAINWTKACIETFECSIIAAGVDCCPPPPHQTRISQ
jgi:hypothetical protein